MDANDEISDAHGHEDAAGTPAATPTAHSPWWSRPDDLPAATTPLPAGPLFNTPLFNTPPFDADQAMTADQAAAQTPTIVEPGPPRRRSGVRQAAAVTVAAVVLSAAASGTVVHLVDNHSAKSTPLAATSNSATSNAPAASSSNAPTSTSSLPPAAQAASDIKTALAKIEPSVVLINDTITSSPSGRGGFGGFGGFQESGAGTGIIISANGQVVTNAHVVNGATAIKVTLPNNGGTHTATIVGINANEDLAVIQIAGVSNLKPATFANSDTAAVGDSVLAVGNALGYGGAPTVTEGILSAKGRSLSGTSDNLTGLLQTDAAINPGNSGGPLVDTSGQVIGINVAVASGSATEPAQNIGFAIPSNTVVSALPALKAGSGAGSQGSTQSSTFLGVSVSDAANGALVEGVEPGSPADDAGLQVGDVITKIDGKAVADGAALQQAIRADKPGTSVTLSIIRNGSPTTVHATLGSTEVSS
jgi:S1-C subfamily serine protease